MENTPANIGIWRALTAQEVQAAWEHAGLRMRWAKQRRAKEKWFGTDAELLANHFEQAKFEAGIARILGIVDPKRINTDHITARLDLPDDVGAWPRACPKFYPRAYLNGQLEDWGILIGGRVHNDEEVGGGKCCVIEARAWAAMEWVKKNIRSEDVGNRGWPFYQVFWTEQGVHPIRTLLDRYHLSPQGCLPGPPPGISQMIDFAPIKEEKVQCTDGCPDRRPSAAGGYICNVCGFYLFK